MQKIRGTQDNPYMKFTYRSSEYVLRFDGVHKVCSSIHANPISGDVNFAHAFLKWKETDIDNHDAMFEKSQVTKAKGGQVCVAHKSVQPSWWEEHLADFMVLFQKPTSLP